MKMTTAFLPLKATIQVAMTTQRSTSLLWLSALLCGCSLQHAKATITSASTITITSKRASCQQDKTNKKQFTLTYEDNVNVNFSDGGQATANKMVISVDTEKAAGPASSTPKADTIKQITLTDNVSFSQDGRKARADEALFLPEKKQCILTGNVHITQKPIDDKGVPMSVDCSKAALDLVSGNVRLLGSEQKPVSTTLILDKTTTIFPTPKPLVQAHAQHPATLTQRST